MCADPCSLFSVISQIGQDEVQRCLNDFVCQRDEDVSFFLKERAIASELNHRLRTYVSIDEHSDKLTIAGFFTVGIAVVQESPETDEETASPELIPVFLVSQIARDDRYSHEELDGVYLLAKAEEMIQQSSDLTGGSAIFLDCKNVLRSYYEDKGYTFISFDEETGLNRMTKPIYEPTSNCA